MSYKPKVLTVQEGGTGASSLNGIVQGNGTSAFTAISSGTSWTPIISGFSVSGTGTYTYQSGKYIQIGPLVFISYSLKWTAHTGSGIALLTNLPINVYNVAQLRDLSNYILGNGFAPSANTINLMTSTVYTVSLNSLVLSGANSAGNATNNNLTSSGSVSGTAIYFAA